jgi:hypothetical protein
MMAAAADSSSAGIWATRPSPMVSSAYWRKASPNDRSCMKRDGHAADHVDQQDQDAGHGIAAHELGGPVHGAVEVGLHRHLTAARLRLLLVDEAGIEVGIDGHLLAGQRVQREAGRHLGDALPPLVTTTKLMIIRMTNTTRPTTKLPPITTLPKASITWPAASGPFWPCSSTTRVEATFRPGASAWWPG